MRRPDAADWIDASVAVIIALLIVVVLIAACGRDRPTSPKTRVTPAGDVLVEVPHRRIDRTGGDGGSVLSFYVPPRGTCEDDTATIRVPLHHAEIWVGHPTRGQPDLWLADTVHVAPFGNESFSIVMPWAQIVRVRLVNVNMADGCWATVGDMYRDKDGEKDRPN